MMKSWMNDRIPKGVLHAFLVLVSVISLSGQSFGDDRINNQVNIIVMGDIEAPGTYQVPAVINALYFEDQQALFNPESFTAHYEVMRDGIAVHNQNGEPWPVILKNNDVVLITLEKQNPVLKSEALKDKPIINDSKNNYELTESDRLLVQPGDILYLGFPGEENFNKDFLINREGMIDLPEVGELKVDGLNRFEAESLIFEQLSEVFLGLDKLSFQFKEKRLLITVLGFVQNPGDVEIPDNGDIQMAINKAGGFVDGAQLNKLQLRRGRDTVITVDFKRYLNTGDQQALPELLPLDVLFVPSSPRLSEVHGGGQNQGLDSVSDRTVIKVFGEVPKPVSFPFQDGLNVMDALLKAGGITRFGDVEQIRVLTNTESKIFSMNEYLRNGSSEKLFALSPGATVYVPKQAERISAADKTVYVMGQVENPGAFAVANEVGFLDVIANAGGPNRYADIAAVRVLRSNGEVATFNLQAFTNGSSQRLPKVAAGDAVFFPEKTSKDDKPWFDTPTDKTIKILGAVQSPGRFDWSEGVDFIDYLSNAGGPTKNADLARVKIIEQGNNNQRLVTEFDLQSFMEVGGKWTELPVLRGGTTLVIPELPTTTDKNTNWLKLPKEDSIYIMGAVVSPGRYAFNEELGFLDILSVAEGPAKEADLSRVRVIHRNEGSPRVTKVNLLAFFETGDESLLPEVKSGDTIFVSSRARKWTEQQPEDTVRIMGAVDKSGRYEFTTNMTILDLLAEAGGPNDTAYIEKILIVNNSCCEQSRASTFDLVDFMKDPDASNLPVLRAGDTVFVPELSQSNWRAFNSLVTDTSGILNVLLMLTNLGWLKP